MKVLIADDNADNRALLMDLLPQWGHEVVSTADGEEAWTRLAENDAPQLVILDWMMPRLDGVQLCRRIRASNRPSPIYIIVLTGQSRSQDVVQALEAGADDYVIRPFDFDELRARLKVGARVLELQAYLCECGRLQAVLQVTGTVCHEMNQPLQIVMGAAQLLSGAFPPGDPNHEILITLREGVERLGEVTRRMMSLTHTRTKPYLNETNRILDLERQAGVQAEKAK